MKKQAVPRMPMMLGFMLCLLMVVVITCIVVTRPRMQAFIEGMDQGGGNNGIQRVDIPRIVWAYWDSDDALPPVVAATTGCWKRRLPAGWTVRVVTPATLRAYLPSEVVPPSSHSNGLRAEHFSDWLRLQLLVRHGGVYMDASTVLHDPEWLVQLHREASAEGMEVAGCHMPSFQTHEEYPIIENYLLMAPTGGSPFVRAWLAEYEHALRIGFDAYRLEVEADRNLDTQNVYRAFGTYLTQHVCAQRVMQRRRQPVGEYALLRDANESVFALHVQAGWNAGVVAEEALSATRFPIIKLRGMDRQSIGDDEARQYAATCV